MPCRKVWLLHADLTRQRIIAGPGGNLMKGRGRYAIACTRDGATFMAGVLFKIAEHRE